MQAQATFDELRTFWRNAYEQLVVPDASTPFGSVLETWCGSVLARDSGGSKTVEALFSRKAPEPFFGRWANPAGQLCLQDKTVVVLINPGNGIDIEHYTDPKISTIGRPFWSILKEFYTTGAVSHGDTNHWLPYKPGLRNQDFDYRVDGKFFAWGWWEAQWQNMLTAIGQDPGQDPEATFVTLELFAYSSSTANKLNAHAVEGLHSSRLASRFIVELLRSSENRPRGVILVNKTDIWRELLKANEFDLVESPVLDQAGRPRAHFIHDCSSGRPTDVPAVVLSSAQQMKFPRSGNGAEEIFARWR